MGADKIAIFKFVIGYFVLAAVVGCVPTSQFPTIDDSLAEAEASRQRIEAVQSITLNKARLADVSLPILANNTELCGDNIKPFYGFNHLKLGDVDEEWRPAYRSLLGVSKTETIINVVKGSPAENAGMQLGDVIMQVDGKPIRTRRDLNDALPRNGYGNHVIRVVQAGAEAHDLMIEAVPVCGYNIEIVRDDSVNAWADGENVTITTGLMNFVASDDELALIVAHELAHNTRGHIETKMGNMLVGTILGAVVTGMSGYNVTDIGTQAGSEAFSQDFEAEADYVGVYLAARAGFDVAPAAAVWRRIGTSHPAGIHLAKSHPSSAKRYLAIEAAAEEVRQKQVAGLPLIPNERKK